MIKLTEIYNLPTEYDEELGRPRDLMSLREIVINPDYVVHFKHCDMLNEKASRGPLVEGLNQDVSFTQLALEKFGVVNVVGSLGDILEKFKLD